MFAILDHYLKSLFRITEAKEKTQLIELFTKASSQCILTTEYQLGKKMARAGLDLMPQNSWESSYEHTLRLKMLLLENMYLGKDFYEAELLFTSMIEKVRSSFDKASILSLRIKMHEMQQQFSSIIACSLELFHELGISIRVDQAHSLVTNQVQQIVSNQTLLCQLRISRESNNEIFVMLMRTLLTMWNAAYATVDVCLTSLASSMMVRLSLEYGVCSQSAVGLVLFAIVLAREGCIELAKRVAEQGLKLADMFPNTTALHECHFTTEYALRTNLNFCVK